MEPQVVGGGVGVVQQMAVLWTYEVRARCVSGLRCVSGCELFNYAAREPVVDVQCMQCDEV